MKTGLIGLFVLLGLFPAQPTGQVNKHTLVFTHATVIDVSGGPVRPDSVVVISGDRITDVGRFGQISIPKDAQVVDASGKFLIPGLWDMHVHPRGAEYLPLFLANGVTGIRVMWGDPEDHDWRKKIEAGELLGPRMIIASPVIDGPKPYWRSSISVANEMEARQAVIKAKQDGADFIKVYQFLPREEYLAIADEARKQGIPFAGHVPISVTAEDASNAGQKSFEHLIGILPACSSRHDDLFKGQEADLAEDLISQRPKFWGAHAIQSRQWMIDTYSPERVTELCALLRKNGTWQVPTLTLLHMFAFGNDPAFLKDARLKYIPVRERDDWDPASVDGQRSSEDFASMRKEFQKDLEVVGAMQKAGVGILAGTDTSNPLLFPRIRPAR